MAEFKEMVKERIKDFYDALDDFMNWVGEYDSLPKDKDAEMIPTLNDKAEIRKALEDGTKFNVEIIYGELLRDAFVYERSFKYEGKYIISPVLTSNIWKSGFDVDLNGETQLTFEFDDYYMSDKEKLLVPFDWDELAVDIMEEISAE